MSWLIWLIPIAIGMGVIGLMAFLWSLQGGQFEDLDGAAVRVLMDDEDQPLDTARGKAEHEKRRRRKFLPVKSHARFAGAGNSINDKEHNNE